MKDSNWLLWRRQPQRQTVNNEKGYNDLTVGVKWISVQWKDRESSTSKRHSEDIFRNMLI